MNQLNESTISIPTVKSENVYRVATFNVHNFTDRRNVTTIDEIIETIIAIDADLIILQETVFYGKSIKKRFNKLIGNTKYKYRQSSPDRMQVNMLLSKLPFEELKFVILDPDPIMKEKRYAIRCEITIGGEKFNIIGTHLDVWDNTGNTRCNQILDILCEIKHPNAIIMGDLNALRKADYDSNEWKKIKDNDSKRNVKTVTKAIKIIEDKGFIDSFVMAGKSTPKVTVWSNRRVDYIYMKNSKKFPIKTFVIKTLCSDHYPVYVDIFYKSES